MGIEPFVGQVLTADVFYNPDTERVVTHLRLNIYPDGGIARLRIYGEIRADPAGMGAVADLVAVENGGRALLCSNEHFGSMHNLTLPGRGVNMGDGWETARRRGPGNDWVILALGHPGTIESVEIDTAHFKGNYPEYVSLEGALLADPSQVVPDSKAWQVLLPKSRLEMDRQHEFAEQLCAIGDISHVQMSIYPDGGISRLRLYGRLRSS
jgi:allantoicase